MWEFLPPKIRLQGPPQVPPALDRRLRTDFERFREGLPRPLESYVRDVYGIELASEYGGRAIKNPFGKASGQLSLAAHQIERDAEAGLGFVVLKTVIAQDRAGEQTMREWAIPETRMLVERIRGRSGSEGWTVTWKGRGWFDTFTAYLNLFDHALRTGQSAGMVIAPSVKYHLPTPQEEFWKEEEYQFTTAALVEIWNRHHGVEVMPLEKDFSPTLAGSGRAAQQAKILEWLERVPGLIHGAAPGRVGVGLKLFNALFEDEFQVRMLDLVESAPAGDGRADFLVYANRLFDPQKRFEDKVGVAYGGPDLSDRNLAALETHLSLATSAPAGEGQGRRLSPLPLSATGDIQSGRIAAEYLLRGATSFQMHTLFQLPDGEFAMRTGTKTEKALHRLLFDPREGFLAWLLDLRQRFGWEPEGSVETAARWCRAHWPEIVSSVRV
jgi:hypothetical protein